ncbi:Peroxiredoxin [Fodinibius salinus]|uniref:Peroxiredoxin n=1 Tax=Fodinibius salinus TaxID=860790 RepID=A0A5D3YNG8_9BACT|nr:TlpA disulfide reductase family protein [Fodinibius salinus]TYP95470.1 Peroxiredoxin [Fodinibius salinus]
MEKFVHLSFLKFLIPVLLVGCTSNQSDSPSKKTEPLEQLDPYSASLYPAQQKAKASDFEMTLVSGEKFSLSEQRGKVVLLNIWATWCAPCREETPDLVELYNKYKDQGLVVLGVSIDKQGMSVVEPFIEKYSVNYPTIIDDGTIIDKYGPTMGIPTTYIIDQEGDLEYFAVGALTNKELEPRIKKMLELGKKAVSSGP